MKKTRILVEKILLFALFTILALVVYYKFIPYIREYGFKISKEKEFTKTEKFKEIFQSEIQHLESSISWGIFEENVYDEEFEQYNRSQTNVEYIFDIEQTNGKKMVLSNIINENLNDVIENFENSNIYYICSLNEWPKTNEETLKYYRFRANQEIFKKLDVYIRINNIDAYDELYIAKDIYEDFSNNYIKYVAIVSGLIIAFIIILIDVSKCIKKANENKLLGNLYIEQIALIIGGVIILGINIINKLQLILIYGKIYLFYIICYVIFSEIYFYIIRTSRQRKKFLLPRIIENFKTAWRTILIYGFVCICHLILVIYFAQYEYCFYVKWIFYIMIWIYSIILLHELSFKIGIAEITKEVEIIKNGNINVSIKCKNKELNELGENINQLKQGMKKAVDESIKAERLKTDLITNVSHDLKTPLTSIINYTDLLKKEKIENENAKKYIEILEKKSKKLKNLTEDLIEASKISSGNEKANLEKIDFKELVLQANGEFAEKFEIKKLDVISNLPKDAVTINLDGKKMWRVLENLYQNVYKYSLENTRVYVDLKLNDHIVFTIKNISKEKLNISPDELMERFIRGDSSRHTGGNGLGLSIAKDLCKINGGTLSIEIDGDLFVAKIEL